MTNTPQSADSPTQPTLDEIVALAKRRGFVYPTSEIYGGLANSYEYGPLGAQLLKNIRDLWWKFFIEDRDDMVGLDSQILQHPTTWEASGHVSSFSDPLVEDTKTGKRYRADHLIEEWANKVRNKIERDISLTSSWDENYVLALKKIIGNTSSRNYEIDKTLSYAYIILVGNINNNKLNKTDTKAFQLLLDEIKRYYLEDKGNLDTLKEIDTLRPSVQENSLKDILDYFKVWSVGSIDNLELKQMGDLIVNYGIKSPDGNPVSDPKSFNLLFETKIGTVEGNKSTVYLRGETAQGIFTNFKQILDSTRVKLPFGVGQMGKSFRNEITTGQFVFRTLEFEQAEIEYFFNPNDESWEELFKSWKASMWEFVTSRLGIAEDNLRWRRHSDAERSFYSKETYDLDYNFSFGWKELWGLAYRTDYDLKQHQEFSKQSLEYTDPHTGEKIIPHVIEPAVGLNRLFLMILTDAYRVDAEKNRTVLSLQPNLAPYHVAVFPLVKNKPELVALAQQVRSTLQKEFRVTWDDRGNIGKRYLYQDEIGTPRCITIDYDSLEDQTVTVRDRDTAEQVRIKIDSLISHFTQHLELR